MFSRQVNLIPTRLKFDPDEKVARRQQSVVLEDNVHQIVSAILIPADYSRFPPAMIVVAAIPTTPKTPIKNIYGFVVHDSTT